jgi:hypothetical protein
MTVSGLLVAAQQVPVFRAGVEYVPVDVVVTDSRDEPITDLTIDEFEIVEAGRRQTIADFRFVSIPITPRDLQETGARTTRPDVATNQAPSQDSRLFVLLIDDLTPSNTKSWQ